MALGVSLILIAVGAILAFAVTATVSGLDVTAVGVILMIVGGFGLVLSMLFLATWAPFYRGERIRTHEEVVREL
jgi:hypothetical protein